VPEIKKAVQTGQAQMGELLMSGAENDDPVIRRRHRAVPGHELGRRDEAVEGQARRSATRRWRIRISRSFTSSRGRRQGPLRQEGHQHAEDMKGLKFRAYNPGTSRIAEMVGAQPMTIQAAEVAQAAATGVMNAFISSVLPRRRHPHLGIADPLLRHPGLAAEEHGVREHQGVQLARQGDAGRPAQGLG